MNATIGLRALLCAATLALAGCGGSDAPPAANQVGATGGTVSGPNGTQVSVPAGALAAPIGITIAPASTWPAAPAGIQLVGTVYDIGPSGTAFSQPVTVTLPFDASQFPPGASVRLLHGTGANSWQELPGLVVGATSVSAQTTSFSPFVVGVGNTPPFLLSQPADASVVAPATASFSVTVLGTPPITFQWQRSDDGGATFVDITGATAIGYTTPATAAGTDNGARFRVKATNLEGSTTSNAATLTVTAAVVAPAITTQPQNLSVSAGSSAAFSVVATGSALTYQWQRSNDAGVTFSNVAGATAASYSLTAAAAGDDNARFRVVVSNSIGSVTSNPATLTVTTTAPSATRPIKLAAGGSHSVAILANGSMVAWGENSIGNLGDGTTTPRSGPVPVLVINDGLTVAASSHTLVVRSTDGSVWAWGNNDWGQVGDINNPCNGNCPLRATPARSGTLLNAVSVAAGSLHSLAARADGTVWAWGNNDHGQLGDGTTAQHSVPNQVPGLSGVVMVAAHGNFSLALKGDGTVWAWGSNNHGQLGDGTTAEQHVPVRVTGLAHAFWIAAGFEHAIAIDDGGAVQHPSQLHLGQPYVWGSNQFGQLGTGSTTDLTMPQSIAGVLRDASGGGAHTLLLYFDNVLFGAGRNAEGQIGDGTTADRSSPAFVSAVLCEAVSAGAGHSLCADATGQVWAWGQNTGGQVGDGTLVNRPTPVRVTGVNIH